MTIYDIAEEAGVSASTVSRVINNKKGVSQKTRILVKRLLEKYNYEPDVTARGLVSHSSKIIGIMVSDIRTLHHAEGAYYIEQHLRKYGYNCIIVNSGISDALREDGIRTLRARRAEAVVMIGSTYQSDGVKNAIREYLDGLPVIIENGCLDLPNVYGVISDEKGGIAKCTRMLLDKGRKNLVFVNRGDTPSNRLKIDGFRETLLKADPSVSPHVCWFEAGEDEWQAGYDITVKLMNEFPETDGIIYTTDFFANAGVRALTDLNIPVPEQVSVIGVDNSIYARISSPRITSLDNQMQNLSILCSDILIKLLNGETVPNKMMIFSNIVERETT